MLAIALMMWVSQGEARWRGLDPSLVTGALIPVAVCAIVGARLYHVIDQWLYYRDHLAAIVLPPYSGLGLYGGIAGADRGHRIPLPTSPAAAVAGPRRRGARARCSPRPSPAGATSSTRSCTVRRPTCPGASPSIAPTASRSTPATRYPAATTGFHPLFLYESIWDLTGGLVALWLSHRRLDRLRDGDLASFWMVWYGGGRLVLESLRPGWDWTVLGIPTAMLIGGALVGLGVATSHPAPPPATSVSAGWPDRRRALLTYFRGKNAMSWTGPGKSAPLPLSTRKSVSPLWS